MSITWRRYSDPLTRFVKSHPSWDDDDVADGYRSGKAEWGGDANEPYDGPLANTAVGLIGLDRENLVFCQYDMWVCEADFDITRRHVFAVARVPGVEVLRPITRYRFLLGVGPQFDGAEVRRAVATVLEPPPLDRAKFLADYARRHYPAWAVLAGPDGQADLLAAVDQDALTARLAAAGELWEVTRRG